MEPSNLRSVVWGLISRARSLWRGIVRRSDVEADMLEEFRHHIDLRTEDLVREGLSPAEARRRAHLEFGHAEEHRRRGRAARGLRVADQIRFSWIDVRLGLRMLVKHPWLTAVAAFALAVGIPLGMAPVHVADALRAPLPEDTGNRVRAVRFWDPVTTSAAAPQEEDYLQWRDGLRSFSALGAYRSATWNLSEDGGPAAPALGAQVTASVFGILGRPAALGRALDAADERIGAPDVVVLGHDAWIARFGADPRIVGRSVRIGGAPHTVVGVMPAGFLFPTNDQLWVPLRLDPSAPAAGGRLGVIGRLADGVTEEQAHAEVAALARPVELAEPRARLRAEVVPFPLAYVGVPRTGLEGDPGFVFFRLLGLALLLVACGNVAMLVFARTATRFRELAVRTALGASRVRIVSQIFVETLVLAVLAAGAGVLVVDRALSYVDLAAIGGEAALPYWLRLGVTPAAALRALVLAVVSATVAGVVPALRITGKGIQRSIQRADAGRSGIRFGGVTGALVIADVALAIVVIGLAIPLGRKMMELRASDALAGIPAEEYLAAEVRLPAEAPGVREEAVDRVARVAALQRAVAVRLQAEPGVRSVAVGEAMPRMEHRSRPLRIEGIDRPGTFPGWYVKSARIDVGYFEALGAPILRGRSFDRADTESDAPPVIVNTVFVEELMGAADPIGRRVRFVVPGAEREPPWVEIVGVVGHLGANMVNPSGGPAVYLPAAPGTIDPFVVGLHVDGRPEALAARVRDIVREVDPGAVLGTPTVLSSVYQGDWYLAVALAAGLVLLVGVLVALAASGIYAMMSFSVSERTREIGIRTALGAPRLAVVASILRRALLQIGVGALLGTPVATYLFVGIDAGTDGSRFVAALQALSLAVGLVAIVAVASCLSPARRILSVRASAALRAEG